MYVMHQTGACITFIYLICCCYLFLLFASLAYMLIALLPCLLVFQVAENLYNKGFISYRNRNGFIPTQFRPQLADPDSDRPRWMGSLRTTVSQFLSHSCCSCSWSLLLPLVVLCVETVCFCSVVSQAFDRRRLSVASLWQS